MKFFRHANQQKVWVWGILLSLLVMGQGVTLHVHDLDHSHSHHQQVIDEAEHHDHHHINNLHFAIDGSHADHHDESVTEIDITPNGIVKLVISQMLIAFALIFFLLILPIRSNILGRLHVGNEASFVRSLCYLLSPPLRAPPQQ